MPGTGEPLLRLTPEEREEVWVALRPEELPPRVRERLEMVKAAERWARASDKLRPGAGERRARCAGGWLPLPRAGSPLWPMPPARDDRRAPTRLTYGRWRRRRKARRASSGCGLRRVDQPATMRLPVEERTGVRIAPGWLRVLLGRRRFACGRPKHTLKHLRDPEELATCEAELEEAGKKGSRGA